jgi:hypothetical protein
MLIFFSFRPCSELLGLIYQLQDCFRHNISQAWKQGIKVSEKRDMNKSTVKVEIDDSVLEQVEKPSKRFVVLKCKESSGEESVHYLRETPKPRASRFGKLAVRSTPDTFEFVIDPNLEYYTEIMYCPLIIRIIRARVINKSVTKRADRFLQVEASQSTGNVKALRLNDKKIGSAFKQKRNQTDTLRKVLFYGHRSSRVLEGVVSLDNWMNQETTSSSDTTQKINSVISNFISRCSSSVGPPVKELMGGSLQQLQESAFLLNSIDKVKINLVVEQLHRYAPEVIKSLMKGNPQMRYILDNLDRICQVTFEPTMEDNILMKTKPHGFLECSFSSEANSYQVFGFGSLEWRCDSRRLKLLMEMVNANAGSGISVFVVDVKGYSKKTANDSKNELEKTIGLYSEFCHRVKDEMVIVTIFNSDQKSLGEHLKTYPLQDYFPEFQSVGLDEDAYLKSAVKFIESLFQFAIENIPMRHDELGLSIKKGDIFSLWFDVLESEKFRPIFLQMKDILNRDAAMRQSTEQLSPRRSMQ